MCGDINDHNRTFLRGLGNVPTIHTILRRIETDKGIFVMILFILQPERLNLVTINQAVDRFLLRNIRFAVSHLENKL